MHTHAHTNIGEEAPGISARKGAVPKSCVAFLGCRLAFGNLVCDVCGYI